MRTYGIHFSGIEMAAILVALEAYGLPGLHDKLRQQFIEARDCPQFDPADDGPEVAILRARHTA